MHFTWVSHVKVFFILFSVNKDEWKNISVNVETLKNAYASLELQDVVHWKHEIRYAVEILEAQLTRKFQIWTREIVCLCSHRALHDDFALYCIFNDLFIGENSNTAPKQNFVQFSRLHCNSKHFYQPKFSHFSFIKNLLLSLSHL